MKIFLVAGKSGSGKAEVARFIKEYYIYQKEETLITAYSKYLKLYAKEMIGWDGSEANKPRDFLQEIGYYIRKDLNSPNFLTDRMLEDIKIYERSFAVCVICDVRFSNEIEEIKAVYDDVTTMMVINQFKQSSLTLEQQAHPTEIALDDYHNFDYLLVNENLDNLKKTVFNILEGK